MAIDPSISLGAKAPSLDATMGTLSGMMDMASKSQALKKSKATYEADVSQRQAESELSRTQADTAKAMAPAQIQQLQTAAHKALLDLNDQQRESVGTFVTSLAGSDPKTVFTKLDALGEFQPQLKPAIDYMKKAHLEPSANDPKSFAETIKKVGIGTMTVPEQFQARTASGPMISNNQQAAMVNQNPGADIPVGQVAPGTAVQMQIPVGAQVFNPNTNAQAMVGPGGGMGPQTAPALGVPENVQGTIDVVNKDFGDTQANAASAQNSIAILQNIKKYSKGAATGIAGSGGIATIASDLARITGFSEGDVKANTDLLAKNANMLALTGGDTNLARTLAEAANPNAKMNPEAIRKAADQVISLHEMSLAKQKYMAPFKANPDAYVQKLGEFNSVADPRIFQLKNMSVKEKSEMKSSMSPAEQKQFGEILRKAESLGIVK